MWRVGKCVSTRNWEKRGYVKDDVLGIYSSLDFVMEKLWWKLQGNRPPAQEQDQWGENDARVPQEGPSVPIPGGGLGTWEDDDWGHRTSLGPAVGQPSREQESMVMCTTKTWGLRASPRSTWAEGLCLPKGLLLVLPVRAKWGQPAGSF